MTREEQANRITILANPIILCYKAKLSHKPNACMLPKAGTNQFIIEFFDYSRAAPRQRRATKLAASGAKRPGRGSAATEWNVGTRATKAVWHECGAQCAGPCHALRGAKRFATAQASQAKKAVAFCNAEP
jgi:hypothetical protein